MMAPILVGVVASLIMEPMTTHRRRLTVKMQFGAQPVYGQSGYSGQQGYQQQDYGSQLLWCIHPFWGVCGQTVVTGQKDKYRDLPYTLRSTGDEYSLGRWNMVSPDSRVSRVQCVVQRQADGTAVLVSRGLPATGWRRGGGPWSELQKGQSMLLSDGDQISMDIKNPESNVFTVQQESDVQQGGYDQQGYGQQGYGQPSSQDLYTQPGYAQDLPVGWVKGIDPASGAAYYYNEQTGQSQWEPPR